MPSDKYFQDVCYWEGAEGYIPVKKDPITSEDKYKFEEKVFEENAVTRHHKPTMVFQAHQFAELQKSDTMRDKQNKKKQNMKNIDFVEEVVNNEKEKSLQKASMVKRFEKTDIRSPDKEQKVDSPSVYTKIKNERD